MITTFYLQNFKSFAEPITANLDDLLVIAGSNSGGKSTIIQALLLLAQTLENPRSDVVLDLGGKFVQFAEFTEAVYGRPNSLKSGFTVGFDAKIEEVDPLSEDFFELLGRASRNSSTWRAKNDQAPKKTNSINIRVTFGTNRSGAPLVDEAIYKKTMQGLGTITLSIIRDHGSTYQIKTLIEGEKGTEHISEADIMQEFIVTPDTPSKRQWVQSSYEYYTPGFLGDPFINLGFSIAAIPIIGTELKRTVSGFKGRKGEQISINRIFINALRFTFQEGLEISSSGKIQFDHFLLPRTPRGIGGSDQNMYRYVRFFDAMFGAAMAEVRYFLRNIKYIGPLRAKPERAYLAIGSPIDIGNAGENAVPILWLYQNEKVINKTAIGGKPNERKLVLAVQDWLQEFGIAYSFHITKPKRVIYQAELESAPGSETMVTIADVGFGVSQLLPVIVAGLRAPEGSTLVLEQPEIHLHPKLQGKLADFLICMVELQKKVIVETHSEHLINMLRLRIAQDKSGNLQNKIGIIFVRSWAQTTEVQGKTNGGGRRGSYIENLQVDEFGKIINWPPDFFPETTSLNEEILKAMMDKLPGG